MEDKANQRIIIGKDLVTKCNMVELSDITGKINVFVVTVTKDGKPEMQIHTLNNYDVSSDSNGIATIKEKDKYKR